MRHQNELLIRALLVASFVLAAASPSGLAASADVHVRVEGVGSTIVDRVVRTDGHDVRASSDSQSRHCDSTNNGENATPGPAATAATVDALAALGQTFDGQWYPGLDDYFIRQLGPEREDNDKLWWWGLLVNRAFTPVGGCQVRLHDGDEVLWADDAFSNRPFLWLSAPSASPTVLVDTPLTVVVGATNTSTTNDDRSADPYLGAPVGAVTANGQAAPAGVADGGTSGVDGSATVTFHQPGWQRVKARGPTGAPGAAPAAIASNSVDVCVEATAGAGCVGAPPSQRPPASGDAGGGGAAGPGGSRGTSRPAWLRRFATGTLRDDRARGLRWSGPWQRMRSTSAWGGTLSRGKSGATVRLRVGAGRPAFLLRLMGRTARIELRGGRRSTQVALPAALGGGIRIVRGPRLARTGVVRLRVLSGAVRLDGAGRAA